MIQVYGITFDHTWNYGSCFQAYALKTAIEKSEANGESCSYNLIPISQFNDHPKKKPSLLSIPGRIIIRLWRKQFRNFEQKIKYAPIKSMKELYDYGGKQADAYVCGSDVIWNSDHNRDLTAYYLDFTNKYSFSYAASFGKEVDKKEVEKYKDQISRLNQISVREKSSKDIIEAISGKKVKVVADPVILLTKDEWNAVIPQTKNNEKYIFVYTTRFNNILENYVNRLAQQTNLKIIRTAWARSLKTVLKQGIMMIKKPEDWLQLLRDAEYVVTNSFHATVFSILFHKKFFTIAQANIQNEIGQGINVRMNDFLKDVGLEDRIYADVPEEIDLNEIDYSRTDERIRELREESLAFLQENLEAAYKAKIESQAKEF